MPKIAPSVGLIHAQDEPLSAVSGPVDVVVGIARPGGILCTLLDLGLGTSQRPHPTGSCITSRSPSRVCHDGVMRHVLPPNANIKALIMGLDIEGETNLLNEIRGLERSC